VRRSPAGGEGLYADPRADGVRPACSQMSNALDGANWREKGEAGLAGGRRAEGAAGGDG